MDIQILFIKSQRFASQLFHLTRFLSQQFHNSRFPPIRIVVLLLRFVGLILQILTRLHIFTYLT